MCYQSIHLLQNHYQSESTIEAGKFYHRHQFLILTFPTSMLPLPFFPPAHLCPLNVPATSKSHSTGAIRRSNSPPRYQILDIRSFDITYMVKASSDSFSASLPFLSWIPRAFPTSQSTHLPAHPDKLRRRRRMRPHHQPHQ
jgi:hypothetical protein